MGFFVHHWEEILETAILGSYTPYKEIHIRSLYECDVITVPQEVLVSVWGNVLSYSPEY